jgi:phosphoserine aminotransferase
MSRAHNFSAGPAVMPLSVVEELAAALPEFGDTRLGLMELSHRSKAFEAVVASAQARMRRILGIPQDYRILFLQGGASLQFYMLALNLALPGEKTDYIVTGTWATKALEEARRCSDAAGIWTGKSAKFNHLPSHGEVTPREGSVYTHYTTNNTIYGTQFPGPPAVEGRLIADMSSDIASRPIDVSRHELIYAGAQKNLGPSGVIAVILSPWALERSKLANAARPGGLPAMLDYNVQAENDSLYNTPNTFGIYALERVLAWIEAEGGLSVIAARNTEKANLLYAELDRSGFWRPHVAGEVRSQMNIPWRLPTEALEDQFVKEAEAAGLKGLKGHRSVGGLRASLYNACPVESVAALVGFMQDFERKNG